MEPGSIQHHSADERGASRDQRYRLRLYISGSTPRSVAATQNVKRLCQEHLRGQFELQVIDVYQQPELTRQDRVWVAPTLVRLLPQPTRMEIGDLSDEQRVLRLLDLVDQHADVSATNRVRP